MRPSRWPLLGCALAFALVGGGAARHDPPHRVAAPLSLEEAEILIYLLPVAHQLRAQGDDVTWELETSREPGGSHFFTFWVGGARPNPYGSVTVNYFSVNRHTGQVWELMPEARVVTSPELSGVQKIIRAAQGIGPETIRQYGRVRPPP
jgi:hypothetical protein